MSENFPYVLSGVDDPLFKTKVEAFLSGDALLRYKDVTVRRGVSSSDEVAVGPRVNDLQLYVTTREKGYLENPNEGIKVLLEEAQKQFFEIWDGSLSFREKFKGVGVEYLLFNMISEKFIAAMKDGVINCDYGHYMKIMSRENFLS